MKRETKVGLLVGMLIIVLIGIVVSDHLSVVQKQDQADLAGFAGQSQVGIEGASAANAGANGLSPQTGNAVASQGAPGTPGSDPGRQPFVPAGDRDGQAQSAQDRGRSIPLDREIDPRVPGSPGNDHGLGSNPPIAGQIGGDTQARTDNPRLDTPPSNDHLVPPPPVPPINHGVTPQPVYHYVKPNETLWSIAKRYYGDGGYWKQIKAANANAIGSGDTVRPGVRLVIPNKTVADAEQAAHAPAATDTASVAAGDTSLRNQITDPNVRRMLDQLEGNTSTGGSALRSGGTGNAVSAADTIEVKPGDSLSQISERALGTSRRWREFLDVNRDQLDSEHDIRPGMKLRIPARTPAPTSSSPTAPRTVTNSTPPTTSTTTATADGSTYKVKPGDTLIAIARQVYGDGNKWRDIYNKNKQQIPDPNDLAAGATLIIPR